MPAIRVQLPEQTNVSQLAPKNSKAVLLKTAALHWELLKLELPHQNDDPAAVAAW